jgi:hypothetical protein
MPNLSRNTEENDKSITLEPDTVSDVVGDVLRGVRFSVRRRLAEIEVSNQPYMATQSKDYFVSRLEVAENYFEYGSGASTVMAAQRCDRIITVESDRTFLKAVLGKVNGQRATVFPVYVRTGWTREWGFPVFRRPTVSRSEAWKNYPRAMWDEAARLGIVPDLVLIDGRFRVACVAESFLRLEPNASCEFLMDDFTCRQEYAVLLDVISNVRCYDRLISFERPANFDRAACEMLLQRYGRDWR